MSKGEHILEYEEFKSCVVDSVQKELRGQEKVEVHRVQRNNNRQLDGLMVMREGSSIAPALYLNEYYKEYINGCPLGSIVGEITDFYRSGKDNTRGIDIEFYQNYQDVRPHIFPKLINYEKNSAFLEQVPYVRFLDLAVTFYCRVAHERLGNLVIQIYHSHAALWNVGVDELYAEAMKNSQRKLPLELKSMNDLMGELIEGDIDSLEDINIDVTLVDDHMYVLTNYLRHLGAAVILYPGVLSRFGMAVGCDFYILPSSVHEVILLPAKLCYEKSRLQELVAHVNRTQVAAEDYLSDTVYLYSRKLRKILY